MNILLAFASKHGSTREISEAIAEELQKFEHTVTLRAVEDVAAIDDYDAIIAGSAVYAGNWMPQARKFATRLEDELHDRPLWLFSSGPLGVEEPQPQGDPQGIAELVEATKARGHQLFVGKLEKESLGLGEKLIVRAVKAPYGDFRDWQAIQGWAREIAGELDALPAAVG